jgi:hypothetical protein
MMAMVKDIGFPCPLEHDPESGNRFPDKIMLNQKDETRV